MVKRLRIQLVLFTIIALAGLMYVGGKYARLDQLIGIGQYTVKSEFADSGGIFTNAEVTYRGVPVGRVGDLRLTPGGVQVDLIIDSSGPKIPANASAVVANRSAIGEQYVDLQPSTDQGPYLADGSTIESTKTSTPTPVESLLSSVNTLANSVPIDKLRTLVTELGKGFAGTGDDLQTLVTSLDTLSQAGLEALPQTLTLVRDSTVVLGTQSDQSSSIAQFSRDLDSVTAQLRANDPDIRRLIDNGIPASDQVGALVNQIGAPLTQNLTSLAALADTLSPRTFALRPLLQLLPGLSVASSSATPGDSTVHQGGILEVNNPPPCTVGYEGTRAILDAEKAKDPNFNDEQQDFPLNSNANCTVPQGSVTGVRSANRAIFADPTIDQPWDTIPKVAPAPVNLNPIASQLAPLVGVTVK